MHAYIYKSQRKPDTYLYLARKNDFDCLPAPIRERLQPFEHVLDIELTPERRLAREDPATVRSNLADRGFHLQMPPSSAEDPMQGDWGTDA